MSNLSYSLIHIPVANFLEADLKLQDKVAGLLDYGYSPRQIAEMLKVREVDIDYIMKQHGYEVLTAQPLTSHKEE